MSTPVLSLDPVARRRPSGDHFVYQTSSQWSASVWIVSQGKSSFEHWWSTERKEGSILKVAAAVGSVSGGGGGNEKGESARLANEDRLWYRHLKGKSRRFHLKSFIGQACFLDVFPALEGSGFAENLRFLKKFA